MDIIVTGGAGFIGSAVVRHILTTSPHRVLNVDKLTYSSSLLNVATVADDPRYQFVQADITDGEAMHRLFREFAPEAILHLAAESHVDRSIDSPRAFVESNIVGTFVLLEATRAYLSTQPRERRERFRFHHVSTDEVFGDLGEHGRFNETSPYVPSSPYSASKAAADHLVRAWHRTYGVPVLITNCSNNFGPFQHPEKLIPTMILNALSGRALPVYGDGCQVRDWLHVEDHAIALLRVLEHGEIGETYNIGGACERRNIEVVETICRALDASKAPRPPGVASFAELISFVTDRPGHDRRYAIDASKIAAALGWRPRHDFETALYATVRWYLDNLDWCDAVAGSRAAPPRLGLGRAV
ncbi:MAG: dTDP-glucose 4,6-dehydratase [Gammaproteobacteria bacterium]